MCVYLLTHIVRLPVFCMHIFEKSICRMCFSPLAKDSSAGGKERDTGSIWDSTQKLYLVWRYLIKGSCSKAIVSFVASPDNQNSWEKYQNILIGVPVAITLLLLLLLLLFIFHRCKAKNSMFLKGGGEPTQRRWWCKLYRRNREGNLLGAGEAVEGVQRQGGVGCFAASCCDYHHF